MEANNNYLLLFNMNVKDTYSFREWSDFISRVNEEVNNNRPKSTLVSASQKARYQLLSDKAKELERKSLGGDNFEDFIQAQRSEMLKFQAEKAEEIKSTLRFCDEEKLKSYDFAKTLCAKYSEFQMTEDIIMDIIEKVLSENSSDRRDFSNFLSKEDAKAIESALIGAGYENISLYEVLEERETSSVESLQEQANKRYENARKSNDGALSTLFGQCLKVFKTDESKKKYDNYLNISRYKKINRNIDEPIRLTGINTVSENIASKIITQAVKDYPEISRAQAAEYIKKHCEYWGYVVSIADSEFVQTAPSPNPKAKEEEDISKLLQNAEDMYKKAKDRKRAGKLYEEIINLAPTNPFGWFGMACIITDDFSVFTKGKMGEARYYATKALNLATGNDASKVQSKWNAYITAFDSKQREYRQLVSDNDRKISLLQYRNSELIDEIERYRNNKWNLVDVISLIIKIGLAGIFSSALYIAMVILFGYVLSNDTIFKGDMLELIMIIIANITVMVLPIIVFVCLVKKLSKKNISKKHLQKIEKSEQELSENEDAIEKLKQENKKLKSYL